MACSCAPADRAALEAMMLDAAWRLRCTREQVVDYAITSLALEHGYTTLGVHTDQWSVVDAMHHDRRRVPVRVQCDEVSCGIVRIWLHVADHPPVHVTVVELLAEHRVRVAFDDGVVVERDLQPLLTSPVFGAINVDLAEFAQIAVDPDRGVLCWPNGADIDPDLLRYDDLWNEAVAEAGCGSGTGDGPA